MTVVITMDETDLATVPVYRLANTLRRQLSEHLADIGQALGSDQFDVAANLLTEAHRMTITLETILEDK